RRAEDIAEDRAIGDLIAEPVELGTTERVALELRCNRQQAGEIVGEADALAADMDIERQAAGRITGDDGDFPRLVMRDDVAAAIVDARENCARVAAEGTGDGACLVRFSEAELSVLHEIAVDREAEAVECRDIRPEPSDRATEQSRRAGADRDTAGEA